MFGWEYPPHILGGLGTASFGITEGLHAQGDMEIAFCLPKPWGDEDKNAASTHSSRAYQEPTGSAALPAAPNDLTSVHIVEWKANKRPVSDL